MTEGEMGPSNRLEKEPSNVIHLDEHREAPVTLPAPRENPVERQAAIEKVRGNLDRAAYLDMQLHARAKIRQQIIQHAGADGPLSVPTMQFAQNELNDLRFKDQKLREGVTGGLLIGGALSIPMGMGAAVLGVAEATTAITAGAIGLAACAGGIVAIPPALYAWHKWKESRREKRYSQSFGQPASKSSWNKIWGIF